MPRLDLDEQEDAAAGYVLVIDNRTKQAVYWVKLGSAQLHDVRAAIRARGLVWTDADPLPRDSAFWQLSLEGASLARPPAQTEAMALATYPIVLVGIEPESVTVSEEDEDAEANQAIEIVQMAH